MNNKLNTQDVIDALVQKHDMSKKDAAAFVKEFFLLIEQALESDKTVKLKGLGTFKIVEVGTRESVNVNTGERFTIQGHSKISFVADATLRDMLNKPFAHFETTVLNNETEPEEENIPPENIPPVEHVTNKSVQSMPLKAELPVNEEPLSPIQEEKPEESKVEEESCPDISKDRMDKIDDNISILQKTNKKTLYTFLIITIVSVLLMCGIALLFVFSFPDKKSNNSKSTTSPLPVPVATDKSEIIAIPADTFARKAAQTETPVKEVADAAFKTDSVTYVITGTKTTYKIKKGETLTKVSLRFYGTKELWLYILKHNSKKIQRPEMISEGMILKIPELKKKE